MRQWFGVPRLAGGKTLSCKEWAVWAGVVIVGGGCWFTAYPGSSLPSTKACAGWKGFVYPHLLEG